MKIDNILASPELEFPSCDRLDNVIGSGLTNGRKFFPEGINLVKGQEYQYIVDLACGNGYFLSLASKSHPNSKLIASDLSEISTKETQDNFKDWGIRDLEDIITCDAKRIHEWSRKIYSKDSKILICMWYLVHEISESKSETIVDFFVDINKSLPNAEILMGEIVKYSPDEMNRNHNLAVAALERTTAFDLQNSAQTSALYAMLGQFGMNMFTKYLQNKES